MNCRKCGAEALDSSRFCRLCGREFKSGMHPLRKLALIIALMMIRFGLISILAHAQTPGRRVWLRMRSGPIVTGELVKMDTETIEFKVKGILQSVKLDELIGVMFISPAESQAQAKAQMEAAQANAAAARERNAALQKRIEEDRQPRTQAPPTQTVEVPKSCAPHYNHRIDGGQYAPVTISNYKHDFHHIGDYTIKGGKADVYIVDDDNFVKLVNHHKFEAIYAQKGVTEGEWNIALQQGRDYHIVFINPSIYDVRLVDANFCSRVDD